MLKLGFALTTMAACLPGTIAFTSTLPLHSAAPTRIAAVSSLRFASNAARNVQRSSIFALRAKDEGLQDVGAVAGGFSNKGEPAVQLRGFSLADAALFAGLAITLVSFYNYFSNGGSVTSLGFIYGVPITLGGFALKYAEILPVPVETNPKGDAIFEAKATEVLRKIKNDVTRHRYGDDAHLDTALEKLGLVMPGKGFPQMIKIQLAEEKGELSFTMVFRSPDTPFKVWADPARVRRYETFFGPGVNAEVIKVSKEDRLVAIKLTTGIRRGTGSLAGETGSAVTAGGAVSMDQAPAPAAAAADKEPESKRTMEV